MSKFKEVPRCPYCGGEMRIEKPIFADKFDASLVNAKAGWCTQATCNECGAASPFISGMETEKDAYEVAREKTMRRWQEPNRVLTLEEICTAEVCWTETPRASLEACRIVMREYTSFPEGKPVKSFDFYSTGETVPWCYRPEEYGVSVRCWLRKPTPEEMANTPWEAG